MAAETGFTIEGDLYPMPVVFDLDMDESEILWDIAQVKQEDFVQVPGESDETHDERLEQLASPKFWRAMMTIAYRRKHRDEPRKQIDKIVGKQNRLVAMASLAIDDEGVKDDPPALTTEPEQSSRSGPVAKQTTSTGDSSESSGTPVNRPTPIGTIASGTSSTSVGSSSAA